MRPTRLPRKALAATALLGVAAVAVSWAVSPSVLKVDPFHRHGRVTQGGAEAAVIGPTKQVSIAWAGDITPGSRYGLPPNRGFNQFAGVSSVLRDADLTIGNLEGTLGDSGTPRCPVGAENCFSFQAPSSYADGLKHAGFDVFNLANNHALDYGAAGQGSTVAALRSRRLGYTGRPGDLQVVTRNGLRIAILGFSTFPGTGPMLDVVSARMQISDAQKNADIVVACVHAGEEGIDKTHVLSGHETQYGDDRGDSRTFAHAAIDAGADMVVGSGPHVVRGLENYKGRTIAYSTGNFSGYNNFSLRGNLGLSGIVTMTFAQSGSPVSGHWTPVIITGPGTPQIDSQALSSHLVNRLSREDFGINGAQIGRGGEIAVASNS